MKRLFAILLAIVMMMSFAACGSSDEETDEETEEETEEAEEETEEAEEETEEEEDGEEENEEDEESETQPAGTEEFVAQIQVYVEASGYEFVDEESGSSPYAYTINSDDEKLAVIRLYIEDDVVDHCNFVFSYSWAASEEDLEFALSLCCEIATASISGLTDDAFSDVAEKLCVPDVSEMADIDEDETSFGGEERTLLELEGTAWRYEYEDETGTYSLEYYVVEEDDDDEATEKYYVLRVTPTPLEDEEEETEEQTENSDAGEAEEEAADDSELTENFETSTDDNAESDTEED